MTATDKRSSLFSVKVKEKKVFITMTPVANVFKTFYGRNYVAA
jgi:hypothetical protein